MSFSVKLWLGHLQSFIQRYDTLFILIYARSYYYKKILACRRQDFESCKTRLIERGERFADTATESRKKISKFGDRFIHNGRVILVHGHSRVVMAVLKHAAQQGKDFSVIVTEGRPYGAGYNINISVISSNTERLLDHLS